MLKRAGLLALLVLVVTPVAQAHTTIIEPMGSHFPYQRWANHARVPTPDARIEVVEDASWCFGLPCTDGAALIYFPPHESEARFLFIHELGHIWDHLQMTAHQRARFVHLIRQPRLPWSNEDMPADSLNSGAEEWFADSYAYCGLRQHFKQHTVYNAGDGVLGASALRRICGMIRN